LKPYLQKTFDLLEKVQKSHTADDVDVDVRAQAVVQMPDSQIQYYTFTI